LASSTAFCFSLQSGGGSAASAIVEKVSEIPVSNTISVRLIIVLLFVVDRAEEGFDRAEV
jgi:hypothetical protein